MDRDRFVSSSVGGTLWRGPLRGVCAVWMIWILAALAPPASAEPLLPDLFSWARDTGSSSTSYMYRGSFDTDTFDNRVLYRFNAAIPNIGDGPLQVTETTNTQTNVQTVYQHIFDSEGGDPSIELVGVFPDKANTFGHLWLMGLAQYNLREVTPGEGVGPIVSSHDKTSMGIVDSTAYDTSLPGAPANSQYVSANAEVLGISIGWADLYGRSLPGQWVDATGLPDGQYWLEVVIDPYNVIQETDDALEENNNTTRILVNLTIPDPQIHAGDYNDNGIVDAADYTVWRDTLGQSVGINLGSGADGDGDGTIGLGDYDVWKEHFGEVAGAGSGSLAAVVPEPAAASLLIAGLLLPFIMRRKRLVFSERT
jgi:hypothetical protein